MFFHSRKETLSRYWNGLNGTIRVELVSHLAKGIFGFLGTVTVEQVCIVMSSEIIMLIIKTRNIVMTLQDKNQRETTLSKTIPAASEPSSNGLAHYKI